MVVDISQFPETLEFWRLKVRNSRFALRGSAPPCFTFDALFLPLIQCLGAFVLRTLFPLTAFKNARNPKFVRNLSQRLFLGVPVRGTEIWKNLSKFVRKLPFFKFRQIFPNFSPPDWNPQKQSLGQISDKFGVSGVFEGCKGEKGSQPLCF